jgi:uncharacterized protein (DUF2141 family)
MDWLFGVIKKQVETTQMKKILILIIATIFMSFTLQKNEETFSLTIVVKDLRNSKGIVQFSLYNKNGTIPDEKFQKMFKKQRAKIINGASVVTFKNLLKGRYAVNMLHDENSNGKVDKGFMLPIEGVGFTNYKSIGLRNKPNFNKASFPVNSNITKHIQVIYF